MGKHTKKRAKREKLNVGLFTELPTVDQIVDRLLCMTIQTGENSSEELRAPGDEFVFMGGTFLLMQFLVPTKKYLIKRVTEHKAELFEKEVIARLSHTHIIINSTAKNVSQSYNFRCYRAIRKGVKPLKKSYGGAVVCSRLYFQRSAKKEIEDGLVL